MATSDLEFRIFRRSRREDSLDVVADPADTTALQGILRNWLVGNGWHAGRWQEFSAEVRAAGQNRVIAKVRV